MGFDDRGQLLPLVALLVAMALGLAVLIVETALLVGERAIAQIAADAAALASAVDPGNGRGGSMLITIGLKEKVHVMDGIR